ncbi:hypothetical protein ACFL6U_25705 [Planctomycetota bacterium]
MLRRNQIILVLWAALICSQAAMGQWLVLDQRVDLGAIPNNMAMWNNRIEGPYNFWTEPNITDINDWSEITEPKNVFTNLNGWSKFEAVFDNDNAVTWVPTNSNTMPDAETLAWIDAGHVYVTNPDANDPITLYGLTMSGNGEMTIDGGHITFATGYGEKNWGYSTVCVGRNNGTSILNIKDGTFTVPNGIRSMHGFASDPNKTVTGIINQSGGTYVSGDLFEAAATEYADMVEVAGLTDVETVDGAVEAAANSKCKFIYNLSGGLLDGSSSSRISMGKSRFCTGIMNVSGGVLDGGRYLRIGYEGFGELNISGGLVMSSSIINGTNQREGMYLPYGAGSAEAAQGFGVPTNGGKLTITGGELYVGRRDSDDPSDLVFGKYDGSRVADIVNVDLTGGQLFARSLKNTGGIATTFRMGGMGDANDTRADVWFFEDFLLGHGGFENAARDAAATALGVPLTTKIIAVIGSSEYWSIVVYRNADLTGATLEVELDGTPIQVGQTWDVLITDYDGNGDATPEITGAPTTVSGPAGYNFSVSVIENPDPSASAVSRILQVKLDSIDN